MKFQKAFAAILALVFCVSLAGCNWWGNDDDKKTPEPTPTGYEVSLYKDGKVESVQAESYRVEGTQLSYQVKDAAEAQADAPWAVKHNAWKSQASEKRYQATLYDGKTPLASWSVRTFTTDAPSVLLFPADGSQVLRVAGNLVIKSLSAGSAKSASARINLLGQDGTVFSVEVSSYTVIGDHVQAEAADGSGSLFIWGKVQVESLK